MQYCLQDLMEVKMLRELKAVCGKLELLEKTSLEALRSENSVSLLGLF